MLPNVRNFIWLQPHPGIDFPLVSLEVPSLTIKMVFLDQEFTYGDLICADDTITTEGWVTQIKSNGQDAMTRFTIACEGDQSATAHSLSSPWNIFTAYEGEHSLMK